MKTRLLTLVAVGMLVAVTAPAWAVPETNSGTEQRMLSLVRFLKQRLSEDDSFKGLSADQRFSALLEALRIFGITVPADGLRPGMSDEDLAAALVRATVPAKRDQMGSNIRTFLGTEHVGETPRYYEGAPPQEMAEAPRQPAEPSIPAIPAIPAGGDTVAVPNLVGQSLAMGTDEAAKAGLVVRVGKRVAPPAPGLMGQIFEQDPGPGATVPRGSRILVSAYRAAVDSSQFQKNWSQEVRDLLSTMEKPVSPF